MRLVGSDRTGEAERGNGPTESLSIRGWATGLHTLSLQLLDQPNAMAQVTSHQSTLDRGHKVTKDKDTHWCELVLVGRPLMIKSHPAQHSIQHSLLGTLRESSVSATKTELR